MEKSSELANDIDARRDSVFDQAVDEQTQLENELERKPDNEKLKQYLFDVRNYIDKLLAEVDEEGEATPEAVHGTDTAQAIGQVAVQDVTANATQDASVDAAQQIKYVDSQGYIHDTPKSAIRGDVARENNISSASNS